MQFSEVFSSHDVQYMSMKIDVVISQFAKKYIFLKRTLKCIAKFLSFFLKHRNISWKKNFFKLFMYLCTVIDITIIILFSP